MDRLDPTPVLPESVPEAALDVPPFVTRVRVRYAETDAAGVVYYANYLAYMEVARVEWLRALGCPVKEAEARGVHLPVVEARVRYLQPAHLDDLVEIRILLTDVKRASFSFDYEMRRGEDLIARGYTRHAVVERESLRPLAVPAWLRDLLGRARRGDARAIVQAADTTT
jgi:acyl-CoA thioester hydrolase